MIKLSKKDYNAIENKKRVGVLNLELLKQCDDKHKTLKSLFVCKNCAVILI